MNSEVEPVVLRQWYPEVERNAPLLDYLIRHADARDAIRNLRLSNDLTVDELIKLSALNSLAVREGWEPPVSLSGWYPQISVTVEPLLAVIFGNTVLPVHRLNTEVIASNGALSEQAAAMAEALFRANQIGDDDLVEHLQNELTYFGIQVDLQTETWSYERSGTKFTAKSRWKHPELPKAEPRASLAENKIVLQKWNEYDADFLKVLLLQVGGLETMRSILQNQDITPKEIVTLGRLNSTVISAGMEPVVPQTFPGRPKLSPIVQKLVADIFRPATYPAHLHGNEIDIGQAFCDLVETECIAILRALEAGDKAEADAILKRLTDNGIKVDLAVRRWEYSGSNGG